MASFLTVTDADLDQFPELRNADQKTRDMIRRYARTHAWLEWAKTADASAIAIHEAGHAVAVWALDKARYCGRARQWVYEIAMPGIEDPDDAHYEIPHGFLGSCRSFYWLDIDHERLKQRKRWSKYEQRRAVADIAVLMAGQIAEKLISENPRPYKSAADWLARERKRRSRHADGSDLKQVELRINVFGENQQTKVDLAFELSDKIVRGCSRQILYLGLALLKARDGVLKSDQIYAILDEKKPREVTP